MNLNDELIIMKPEDIKKLNDKLKNSDDVKIKLMKIYPIPQHNLTKEDAKDISEEWGDGFIHPSKEGSTVLKELEFKTNAYPLIKIEDLDMCSNMDETVDLNVNFRFYITKKKLFELIAALHTSDMLWCDDCFPITVNMKVEPKPNDFHWKKKIDEP